MRTFFKDTFAIERLTKEVGASKETYVAHGTVTGIVLGIAPDDTLLSEGNPSNSAVLNCDVSSDIAVTDRITKDGEAYIVKSVKNPTRLFSITYKRCIIEKMRS